MKTLTIGAVTLALLLGGGYFFFSDAGNDITAKKTKVTKTETVKHENTHDSVKKDTLVKAKKQETKNVQPKAVLAKVTRVEPTSYEGVMIPVSVEEAKRKFAPKKRVEPALAFTVDQKVFEDLNIGDTFTFPEIDGNVYETVIISKERTKRGSLVLKGATDPDNPSPRELMVITKGKNFSFISLSIDGKSYDGEIKGNTGYFYRASDMSKAYIDPSKTDEIRHSYTKKEV